MVVNSEDQVVMSTLDTSRPSSGNKVLEIENVDSKASKGEEGESGHSKDTINEDGKNDKYSDPYEISPP